MSFREHTRLNKCSKICWLSRLYIIVWLYMWSFAPKMWSLISVQYVLWICVAICVNFCEIWWFFGDLCKQQWSDGAVSCGNLENVHFKRGVVNFFSGKPMKILRYFGRSNHYLDALKMAWPWKMGSVWKCWSYMYAWFCTQVYGSLFSGVSP